MLQLHDVYALLYACVAVLSLTVGLIAWQHLAVRGAGAVTFMMAGVSIWSAATAMSWHVVPLEQQMFWSRMMNLGVWMVPVGFFALAVAIAHLDEWLKRSRILPIAVGLFAVNNIEWFNPYNLYVTRYSPIAVGTYPHFTPVPGPLYWLFVVYSYGLVLASLVLLTRVFLRATGAKRTQAATIAVGGAIPFVASIVSQAMLDTLHGADLAPLAFLITGVLWLNAIMRGELLDIIPVARNALFDQIPDGVVVVDTAGAVIDANPAALTILNLPSEEVLHRPAETVLQTIQGADGLLRAQVDERKVLPMGSGYVDVGVTPLRGATGAAPRLVTLRDVTEDRRAHERLRLAGSVFDSANEGIVVALPATQADPSEQIVEVNEAFCRMTGHCAHDIIGTTLASLRSDRHKPEFYEAINEALYSAGEWRGEVWQRKADGTAFPVWLSASIARDEEGVAKYVVAVSTDLSDVRRAEEEIRFNATHDSLTGLPNRVLLDDRLKHALSYARRVRGGLAVFLVDLDNFKTVNDTMGHASGDELLVQVARRARLAMRESDTVGRHGGDEFACVLPDVSDPVELSAAAHRLLEELSESYTIDSREAHISASIGVAVYPDDGEDAATLVQHADIAMYSAKSLGRRRVQFYSDDLQRGLEERAAVEQEIWNALAEDRYFLLYQPQVDLSTGRITGAEALLRLRRKDGGVMPPSEFMHLVEDSDLVVELGDWVVRRACTELCALHIIQPELTMSVNLSARQFKDIDVSALLQDVLPSCHVDPRSLDLEITESSLLADPLGASTKLEELRDVAGVRLSLDDFGTGYSSLTYVRMIHANTVKIDRSFISLLPEDPEAQAVVRSIIALAAELNASVIAEGPETEEQVRFLRDVGCDSAQGYYFSRPIPADEFAELLRRGPFRLPEMETASPKRRKKAGARN